MKRSAEQWKAKQKLCPKSERVDFAAKVIVIVLVLICLYSYSSSSSSSSCFVLSLFVFILILFLSSSCCCCSGRHPSPSPPRVKDDESGFVFESSQDFFQISGRKVSDVSFFDVCEEKRWYQISAF